MAFKLFLSFTLVLLIFTSFADSKPSAFDFIGHIQGCQKGEKSKEIQELKQYLQRFGYLNYQNASLSNNDYFDDELEFAIKTYQLNFHLNVTGILDSETVSKMMMPRCGVADIIDGKTRMESGKNNRHRHHKWTSKFHTVSHFSFYPGNPRWPKDKYHLTYGFQLDTLPAAVEPVKSAFRTWQAHSQFTFEITDFYNSSDLKINFYRGDHGDRLPFDGPFGDVAHAFPPKDGRLHFDADEKWVVGKDYDGFDIERIALHEIGHLLGLDHSSVEDSIMFPITLTGDNRRSLNDDDIIGIQALYNLI